MSTIFEKLYTFFISVIAPIVLGYLLKTFTKLKKEDLNILLIINIVLIYPISLALIFWDIKINSTMLLLPVLGFISPIISGYIGYLFSKKKYSNPNQKGSYVISNMLSNRGTIGGLTMYIIFGEIGYAYVNLINLFSSINIYFIAFPLGSYYSGNSQSQKLTFKNIVFQKTNMPIIGILLGIILHFIVGLRPAYIASYVDPLIKFMAWLALIPIGASIDFKGFSKHLKKVIDISIIKFIIMPLLSYIIAFLIIPDKQAATIFVLLNFMPVAINAVIVSKLTNLDEHVAIAAFLFTTTIYLLIVFPVISIIFT